MHLAAAPPPSVFRPSTDRVQYGGRGIRTILEQSRKSTTKSGSPHMAPIRVTLVENESSHILGKCNRPRPEAEADYSRYHKNRIQLLFYYALFYGKYIKNYCVKYKKILFVLLKIPGQTQRAAASLEIIYVLAHFSQRCITHAHCAGYNLKI